MSYMLSLLLFHLYWHVRVVGLAAPAVVICTALSGMLPGLPSSIVPMNVCVAVDAAVQLCSSFSRLLIVVCTVLMASCSQERGPHSGLSPEQHSNEPL
jgi:hypothetical protein